MKKSATFAATLAYSTSEINRNYRIKVYGLDENGNKVNKLVGVSGLLKLVGDIALDTRTTVSAVRDLTAGLYSKDTIMQKAIEIQGASEIDVDFDKELKGLVKNGSLLKAEKQEVEKVLMRNDPNDGVQGGATLWKLTQAITAHARELEPARARELHEISGALLNRVKIEA